VSMDSTATRSDFINDDPVRSLGSCIDSRPIIRQQKISFSAPTNLTSVVFVELVSLLQATVYVYS
jgi:hypothetical protein